MNRGCWFTAGAAELLHLSLSLFLVVSLSSPLFFYPILSFYFLFFYFVFQLKCVLEIRSTRITRQFNNFTSLSTASKFGQNCLESSKL
ncbi:hypothetical protein Scep_022625 [Stephania cephalantha]|uniref:Uncharacterized protein n=1 Tax=Stephania cephalantha TaxID=152367 RepID=A0AAP0I2B3_9MAGN